MIFVYILSILWTVRLLANVCSYIHLWYIKEYRFDRMIIHLKTPLGRQLPLPQFRIPPLTPKTFAIMSGVSITLVALFSFIPYAPLVRFLILDIFLFPIVSLFVLFLKVPTMLYHTITIWRAVRKLRNHKKMTVIGITGSYGKTSTKEMLYTILSRRYKTLKTEASKNSPIGIAEVVLSKLSDDHEIFIVEMGAYKQGEIAYMCRMVHPDMGIITAVNAQHQDLFGSMSNTMDAKYELFKHLYHARIAIANADNEYTRTLARKAKKEGCDVFLYTTQNATHSDFRIICKATSIQQRESGISFAVSIGNRTGVCSVPLLGVHHISNILASALAASKAGMGIDEIIQGCNTLKSPPKTMYPLPGLNGSSFIDDSFNNNPDAACAAIEYMKVHKGRKILVFQPMIELGAYATDCHKRVGMFASEVCDIVILTNPLHYTAFSEGFYATGTKKQLYQISAKPAEEYLSKTCKRNDLVLFKGKEAGMILSHLVRSA